MNGKSPPIIDNLQRNVAQLRSRRNLFFAPVFAAIYILSWWVRFEGDAVPLPWDHALASLCPVILVKVFVFLGLFGSHYWIRHLTFHDLGTLIKASSISSLMLVFSDYLFFPESYIPRSVFMMDCLL